MASRATLCMSLLALVWLVGIGAAEPPATPTADPASQHAGVASTAEADAVIRRAAELLARQDADGAIEALLIADPEGREPRIAALLRTARVEAWLSRGSALEAAGEHQGALAAYLNGLNAAPHDERLVIASERARDAMANAPVVRQPPPESIELGRLRDQLNEAERRSTDRLEELSNRLDRAERELKLDGGGQSTTDQLSREIANLRQELRGAQRAADEARREVGRLESRVSRLESK